MSLLALLVCCAGNDDDDEVSWLERQEGSFDSADSYGSNYCLF